MVEKKVSETEENNSELNLTAIINALDVEEALLSGQQSEEAAPAKKKPKPAPSDDQQAKEAPPKKKKPKPAPSDDQQAKEAPPKKKKKKPKPALADDQKPKEVPPGKEKPSKASSDTKEIEEVLQDILESNDKPPFDPNATMDYKQVGIPYPELPFANEDADILAASEMQAETTPPEKKRANSKLDKIFGSRKTLVIPSGAAKGTAAEASLNSDHDDSSLAGKARKTAEDTSLPAARDTGMSTSIDGPPANYRPLNTAQSAYRIRGGGGSRRFSARSPVLIIFSALLIILCAGVFVYGMNTISTLFSSSPTGYEFNLTKTQTREALDSRIPVLVHYIDTGVAEAGEYISGLGQFVYSNDRYQPDSPDAGATSNEIVSMPQEMTEAQMTGYYEGSYNAYSTDELATYFNGAYVLDLARGELGSWNKLKYVNLNATSIEEEMSHLAEFQELSGDTVTISAEGTDSRGNRVIQGQKVLEGERILFFKIAACPFNDIYNAKSLSGASVFITCTLATYGFFTGSDTIS